MNYTTRLLSVIATAALLPAADPQEFFKLIRENDLAGVRKLIAGGASPDAGDSRQFTPLMYAAQFGSLESLRLLLDSKAQVNQANAQGLTPLLLAAGDPAKAALLLERGADPKAASKFGRTTLMIAAGRAGNTATVKRLIAAGVDVNARDQMRTTALIEAAPSGDLDTIRAVVDAGADVKALDGAGNGVLHGAVSSRDIQRVRYFLEKGADVNAANTFGGKVRKGDIALVKLTPLMMAAPYGSPDMVSTLLKAGARINDRDIRGLTPLMMAVATESRNPKVIRQLLDAGADVSVVSAAGETVLDWAQRFGDRETMEMLAKAGAKSAASAAAEPKRIAPPVEARLAVQKSLELLNTSNTTFFRESGCSGCHHQAASLRATAEARAAGIATGDAVLKSFGDSLTGARPFLEMSGSQLVPPPGDVDTVALTLEGGADAGLPPNPVTDGLVHYLSMKQNADGRWSMMGIARAPMEDTDIARTAAAVHAMSALGWPARQAEFRSRIARAKAWLLSAKPTVSTDQAERLLGLFWASSSPAELKKAATPLLAAQRADGGWAQNPNLASDAFSTGLALHALRKSGVLATEAPEYRKGVAFLLKTQLEDGSWFVRSRSPKFQPYFESGFPHGHDQWISATATAWAVSALAPAAAHPTVSMR